VQRKYAEDTARAINLDRAAGVGSGDVIRRRSGVPLNQPIPSLYSKPVFNEVTGVQALGELVSQFASDDWVYGQAGKFAGNPVRLSSEVFDIYERDYGNAWNAIVADLELAPVGNLEQMKKTFEVLSGATSPLRGIIAIIVDNTKLVADPAKPTEASATEKISKGVGDILKRGKQLAGASSARPGMIVTAQFQPLHRVIEGEPGNTPLDRVIASIAQIHLQLQALPPTLQDANSVLQSPALREQLQALQQESLALPASLRLLVSQLSDTARARIITAGTGALMHSFREDVLAQCNQIVNGRYPFTATSDIDLPLADFGRLFGYGGIFDAFFERMKSSIDTSARPWTWVPGTVGGSTDMLRKLEEAARVRELFFIGGSRVPGLRYSAMLGQSDASVQRFYLDLEGDVLDSRLQQRLYGFVWPGPKGAQLVSVNFEQRFGGRPSQSYHGPWALFRMVDASNPQRESDVRTVLTVRAGGLQGQVILQADSIRNPFGNRDWQRFTCEP
jgi:type VI secretion system protein ImpL